MSIMDIDTVSYDEKQQKIIIIDQTLLPNEIKILSISTAQEMWDAIYLLQVRGAPAIGVFAGFAIYRLAMDMPKDNKDAFYQAFAKQKDYLNSSRPTAVNLSWALKRMEQVVISYQDQQVEEIIDKLHDEAIAIWKEDIEVCRRIGEYGVTLLHDGDGILTHCNAGKLATIRYGTATAPMYLAHEKGWNIKVFCDETRPLLQGARLTSFELYSSGIDTTLICDNMSASVMKKGWIQAVFVGCDRVAANGDTANKIGTSVVAAVAKEYGVPMFICAPTSTIDLETITGDDIVIEERKDSEVTDMWYEQPMAPTGVKVYNPAFDVTDHSLIAGIITEHGIAYPPFRESLAQLVK